MAIQDQLSYYLPGDINDLAGAIGIPLTDLKQALDSISMRARNSRSTEVLLANVLDELVAGPGKPRTIRVVHASKAGIKKANRTKVLTPDQEKAVKDNSAGSIPDVVIVNGEVDPVVTRIEVKYTKSKFSKFPIASAPSSAYDYYVMFQKEGTPRFFVLTSTHAIEIKRKVGGERSGPKRPYDYDLADIFPNNKLADLDKFKGLQKDSLGQALQNAIIARLARAARQSIDPEDLKARSMTIKDEKGNPLRIDGSKVRIDLKFEQKLREFVREILTEVTK